MLAGKPMIAYTIEAAAACPLVDRIIVSTDDVEVADVARQAGAELPFMRPAELAGDAVTDLPVFEHALSWLQEHEGFCPDIVVHLRPTAPLRRAQHITAAIERLIATGADSVRSVCPASQHPYKMWAITDELWLRPFISGDQAIPEAYNMPRQKLPSAYIQNGSVDVAWRRTLLELHSMTGHRIAALPMTQLESVNVDDELDFLAAGFLLEREGRSSCP
jgi:CMP-N-acetylneuraminic acid synthetase